ncbi:hypothetical protein BZZ01_18555 [Nostocales cyanobacterium HT-58-2]|nr:hypothetical protein BZZ01_18555 [Nostocales cyanobacterium HT-58-2]
MRDYSDFCLGGLHKHIVSSQQLQYSPSLKGLTLSDVASICSPTFGVSPVLVRTAAMTAFPVKNRIINHQPLHTATLHKDYDRKQVLGCCKTKT